MTEAETTVVLHCPKCGEPAEDPDAIELVACSECGAWFDPNEDYGSFDCPSCSETIYSCPNCTNQCTASEMLDNAVVCSSCQEASDIEEWSPAAPNETESNDPSSETHQARSSEEG